MLIWAEGKINNNNIHNNNNDFKSHFIPNEELGLILAQEVPWCPPGAGAQLACACGGHVIPTMTHKLIINNTTCSTCRVRRDRQVRNKKLEIIWEM